MRPMALLSFSSSSPPSPLPLEPRLLSPCFGVELWEQAGDAWCRQESNNDLLSIYCKQAITLCAVNATWFRPKSPRGAWGRFAGKDKACCLSGRGTIREWKGKKGDAGSHSPAPKGACAANTHFISKQSFKTLPPNLSSCQPPKFLPS